MPLGTRHDDTGWLDRGRHVYELRRDGGRTWRLNLSWRTWWAARSLVGQRIRVVGERSGYDFLAVRTIVAI